MMRSAATIRVEFVDAHGGVRPAATFVGAIVIGRSEDCDLVLGERGVSAHHCRLRGFGPQGEVVVEDLGSTYGTWLNGARIDRWAPVSPGDVLLLGDCSLRIGYEPEPASSAARRDSTPEVDPVVGPRRPVPLRRLVQAFAAGSLVACASVAAGLLAVRCQPSTAPDPAEPIESAPARAPVATERALSAATELGDPSERARALARVALDGERTWPALVAAHQALAELRDDVLAREPEPIGPVVFDATGRRLLVASGSTLRSWHLDDEPIALRGHTETVTAIAVSPDGRWAFSAGDDRTLRRWDLSAKDPGASSTVWRGDGAPLRRLAVTPGGRWLVGLDGDANLAVWSVDDSTAIEPVASVRGSEGALVDLAVHPSEEAFFTGDDRGVVTSWRLDERGRPSSRRTHESAPVTRIAIDPWGRWLVVGTVDGSAAVWRLDQSARQPHAVLIGHREPITDLAITPDGRQLVTASEDDTLRVWSLAAKDPGAGNVVLSGHTGDITAVRIVAGGRKLISASLDASLVVWDLANKDRAIDRYSFIGHDGPVRSLAIDPEGLVAISGGADGTVRAWDVLARRGGLGSKVLRGHRAQITAAALDRTGTRLVELGAEGRLQTWNLHDLGRRPRPARREASGLGTAVAIDPTGQRVATGDDDGTIVVWPLDPVDDAEPIELSGHRGAINRLAFVGDRLVSASSDGSVRAWSVEAAEGRTIAEHLDEVHALAVREDGHVWSAGLGSTILHSTIAGTPTETDELRGHDGDILDLHLSSDGTRLLSTSADGRARLWSTDGRGASLVLRGHEDAVTVGAISADGRWAATGSADTRILVWNLGSEHPDEHPLERQGHEQSVTALAFVPGTRWLASGSNDATVRVWSLDGEEALTLGGHDELVNELLVIDQGRIVSTSYDGTARVWPIDGAALFEHVCTTVGIEPALGSADGTRPTANDCASLRGSAGR